MDKKGGLGLGDCLMKFVTDPWSRGLQNLEISSVYWMMIFLKSKRWRLRYLYVVGAVLGRSGRGEVKGRPEQYVYTLKASVYVSEEILLKMKSLLFKEEDWNTIQWATKPFTCFFVLTRSLSTDSRENLKNLKIL